MRTSSVIVIIIKNIGKKLYTVLARGVAATVVAVVLVVVAIAVVFTFSHRHDLVRGHKKPAGGQTKRTLADDHRPLSSAALNFRRWD